MSTSRSLAQCLLEHAADPSGRVALVSPNHTLSYAQLAELVSAQAEVFAGQGVDAQSVVGIQCAPDVQHLVLCLAATYLGATSCTIPGHEELHVQKVLAERCGVTHWAQAETAVAIACKEKAVLVRSPEREARLLFSTSGTTGEPKLVVHRDDDLVAQAHRHVGSTGERFACIASMEHNFAKRHRLYVVATGATNVFLEAGSEPLVAQCLALNANVLHVSAFQAQELLAHTDCNQLADIRLKLGGGHVPATLRDQLKCRVSRQLQAGYGTTETGAIGFTDPNDTEAGESVGQPLPGIDVRVVGTDGQSLGTDQRGELAIRCEGMFREYLGNPELTARRLVDGWFYTGDIGYLDAHGRIHLSGRSDDMFVFNSMNIFPQDIESVILEHPAIADTAVIPKVSPVHGHIPVALLVFKGGVKHRLPDVEKFVQQRVGVRRPRQYLIVPEIPRTAAGKVQRGSAIQIPERSDEIRGAIVGMLDERAIESLRPGSLSAFQRGDQDIKLKQLGLDSLARMSLLISLELEFDTIITPQEFGSLRYLGNLVARVLETPMDSRALAPLVADDAPAPVSDDSSVYTVRLFQRMFGYCSTVAQFNQALTTLEVRLTPGGVAALRSRHAQQQLLPATAKEKYQIALARWLEQTNVAMLRSRKDQPEPFQYSKIDRHVSYFRSPGQTTDKTLLICFPPRDYRQMGLPNPVFLQHVNAEKYDVLMVSSIFETGFRKGRSQFDRRVKEFAHWFAEQDALQRYAGIRTFGFSAGARAAIAAGCVLDAELAVCVSGRFHRKRYPLKNLDQILTLRRLTKQSGATPTVLSYTVDNPRDGRFARVMAAVTGARKNVLTHRQDALKHLVLEQLLEQGELANYLACTLFAVPGSHVDRASEALSIEFSEAEAPRRLAGESLE